MANFILEDLKSQIKNGNPVTRLILINVAVFIGMAVFKILSTWGVLPLSFFEFIANNTSFHTSITGILFKPWTLITYMFVHVDIFHIFWNMITMYWFGSILLDYTSSKKIIPVYLMGGVAGALFATVFILLLPSFRMYTGAPMIGASAGVTAIIAAAAFLVPHVKLNLMLIGPVKLIYVALFVIFIDMLNVASYGQNLGGSLAHLGGALMGYVFTIQYRKGTDLTTGISALLESLGSLFKRKPKSKLKTVHRRPLSDEEYNESKIATQEKIDEILDKISKSGYESLSSKEKEFLFKASGKK